MIISSIVNRLNEVFGLTVYTESVEQGFKEPCFFVSRFNTTHKLFLGRRYYDTNQFCINFFPNEGDEREHCDSVAHKLFICLEWLNYGEDLIRGVNMKYDVLDNVLNFYVDYNLFSYRAIDIDNMADVSHKLYAKE